MSLVEQELFTLPGHLYSPPVLSGVRVTRSLVLCVHVFVDRCLSLCPFSFGHCVVCSSSIYGLWLPLWCLQTLLMHKKIWMQWIILFGAGINGTKNYIYNRMRQRPDECFNNWYTLIIADEKASQLKPMCGIRMQCACSISC